jgi:hypothetical protein
MAQFEMALAAAFPGFMLPLRGVPSNLSRNLVERERWGVLAVCW